LSGQIYVGGLEGIFGLRREVEENMSELTSRII
jgi:hypothetical protein